MLTYNYYFVLSYSVLGKHSLTNKISAETTHTTDLP